MMNPTLLVLAAGMGSRYGGLKQIDSVGPNGETIIDYSVYDAIRAGFDKLVFVIRRDIEQAFKQSLGKKFEKQIAVDYVYQELEMIPEGFSIPVNRTRPWGTGHAILVAQDVVDKSFAVINADDFYGADSFQILSNYLKSVQAAAIANYAMVGFILRNTLSEFGVVARGICQSDAEDFLENVVEITNIEKDGTGAKYATGTGGLQQLSGDEIVSMNMWGFTPSIFGHLGQQFVSFLIEHGYKEKSEFFIPTVVNNLVAQQQAKVKVLTSQDSWFGVTYKEDKPRVVKSIQNLINQGIYPARLWG